MKNNNSNIYGNYLLCGFAQNDARHFNLKPWFSAVVLNCGIYSSGQLFKSRGGKKREKKKTNVLAMIGLHTYNTWSIQRFIYFSRLYVS